MPILVIPFDFAPEPVTPPPHPPKETVNVKAITPDRDQCEIRFPRVQGYRIKLPGDRLSAAFDADSTLELTPSLVGPCITCNEGIIGQGVDLNLADPEQVRESAVVHHLARRLLETEWRDQDDDPKLHLFGQLKRVAGQWLNNHLTCRDGTHPAQVLYPDIADIACRRIAEGIVQGHIGDCPIKPVLDPCDPVGSTMAVSFNTWKNRCWKTDPNRCHVNWAVCDSTWEVEFCRVAEAHARVRSYVKNQGLGFEIPYRSGSESRIYVPDFIVLVEDHSGADRPLHVIVEIKGYRGEDAQEKKSTTRTYWVPGVNRLQGYGRWAFAEFPSVASVADDLEYSVTVGFQRMLDQVWSDSQKRAAEWLVSAGGSAPSIKPIPRRRSRIAR